MIWIIISSILTSLLSAYLGKKPLVYLHQITARKLLLTAVISLSLYSILIVFYQHGLFNENIGSGIITNTYSSIFGFFIGAAWRQFSERSKAKDVLYVHRSFFSDQLPIIISIGLILLGVFRTSIFSDLPLAPIRISSGCSLIGIAVWGMTLRLVPEFKSSGILLIDTIIDWNNFINYQWYLEEVIEIEYEQNGAIKSFKTLIPPEDQQKVESLLRAKMIEKINTR